MTAPTAVARLICAEATARRLATFFSECLDPEATACAAFEGDDGRWQLAIHFREPPDEEAIRGLMTTAVDAQAATDVTFEPVATADWVAQSLEGLTRVRAGRFVIHGAHHRGTLKSNDIAIEIEAAMAFGTGHHGTTRGCLLALDALAKRRRFARIADIGTGSGVLGFAAAKIMRRRVVASDLDTIAVEAARGNARLNCVAPLVTFVCAAGASVRAVTARAPYDLIFANILMGPLLRLAVPIRRLAARNGRVVLSGLLPGHANAVLAIYRAQGFSLERRIPLDGWMTLVLKRP